MTIDREKYRAAIVARIWSDDLRAELVDRVVDLVEKGDALPAEVDDALRRATYSANLYRESGGDRGVKTAWFSVAGFLKRRYAELGRHWVPAAGPFEPEPFVEPTTENKAEIVIFRDREGHNLALKTEILTHQQAQAATDYFAKCGKKYSYREARKIIQDVANGLPFPKIDDPAPSGRINKESWAALAAKLDKIGRLPW